MAQTIDEWILGTQTFISGRDTAISYDDGPGRNFLYPQDRFEPVTKHWVGGRGRGTFEKH